MKEIYFIRHGESEANLKQIFAGQREDSPLTEVGRQQAKKAAKELVNKKIKIDRIISSPLKRAHETAKIVAERAGLNLKVEIDDRIAEYDMGDLTGTPHQKINSEKLIAAVGAEDPHKFRDRVKELLNELKQKDETVLLVSHAGVGRIIEVIKNNLKPSNFYDLEALPNAKLIVIDI